jgi:hypothetical protein
MEQVSSIETTLRRLWDLLQSTRAPQMAAADIELVREYIHAISTLLENLLDERDRQDGPAGPSRSYL